MARFESSPMRVRQARLNHSIRFAHLWYWPSSYLGYSWRYPSA